MRFRRPCGGVLEVGPGAVDQLMRHRQLGVQAPEAGGVLLGRLLLDGRNVVIDEATPPAANDLRGPFLFFRKRAPAQKRVRDGWKVSLQTRNYLGEWHTHPEDQPVPSSQDEANWKRVLLEAKFEQDFLFFAIVGRTCTKAWEASKVDLTPTPLEQLNDLSR